MVNFFNRHYRTGLAGEEVFDVACNSGGYCFVAAELGAGRARGFDIRPHWIDQARFVHEVRYSHLGIVSFELGDAKEVKKFGEADIVLFKGIFYHLPDPIHTLLEACAAAREVILVNTATDNNVPEHCLSLRRESRTHVMSGVDGMVWYPGGPAALRPILENAGFRFIDVTFWHRDVVAADTGRMELVARRSEAARTEKAGAPMGFVGWFRPPDLLGGWARQPGHPGPLAIRVYAGNELIGEATADRTHLALSEYCGFEVKLSRPIELADLVAHRIVACAVENTGNLHPLRVWDRLAETGGQEPAATVPRVSSTRLEKSLTLRALSTTKDIQLNVQNIRGLRELPAIEYDAIRFDSNNDCNVHCVYCHNSRSKELIDLDEFRSFITEKVKAVESFQIGCIMEPTLDKRLCDFMLAIARSPANPRREFRLQTNGILLHRHDPERMIEAGLTVVAISVDSARADTHKGLRGGTSLPKVQHNIIEFHKACPSVALAFLTTVTRENIDEVDALVMWGIEAGVGSFTFRQMFYFPSSSIVDHELMPGLLVSAEEFAEMRDRVQAKFGRSARLHFFANDELVRRTAIVRRNSLIHADALPLVANASDPNYANMSSHEL